MCRRLRRDPPIELPTFLEPFQVPVTPEAVHESARKGIMEYHKAGGQAYLGLSKESRLGLRRHVMQGYDLYGISTMEAVQGSWRDGR